MDNSLTLFSTDSESVVLAALMLSAAPLDQVAELLTADDFADGRNKLVFSAITNLDAMRRAQDAVSVVEYLAERHRDDEFGGMAYVGGLIASAVLTDVMAHVRRIRDLAKLRRLVVAIRKAEAGLTNDLPPGQQAEAAVDMILSSVAQEADEDGKLVHEIGGEWLQHLERIHEAGSAITGTPTGFPDLDTATRGLHGGELIILAARPAMGKSVLAMNIAANVAKQGGSVYVLSLEMPRIELMSRLAAADSSAPYDKIQAAAFDEIGGQLGSFVSDLKNRRLLIDDRATMTVPRLRASLKRYKRRVGALDLVVIDYLQLLSSTGQGRYEQVSEISRALKVLAMELDVPIICLSQLNRELEKRPNKRPVLADLRDSGSLEQDANAVLFLYREAAYTEGLSDPWVAELIIAKLRHGKTGTIPLFEQFQHCRFRSADRDSLPENWKSMRVEQKQGAYPIKPAYSGGAL